MTATPQAFQLDRWLAVVLPAPGLIHRLVLTAAAYLHVRDDDRPVDAEAIAGLIRLDQELVDAALVDAADDGLVELTGGCVRPIQEPVEVDADDQERYRIGLTIDCTCGSAAGWTCVTARGRTTGHHQVRRQLATRIWNRDHRPLQVAA